MGAMGVATGTAYSLLGVPGALLLGLIAALTEAIPIVGPLLGRHPGCPRRRNGVARSWPCIVAGVYIVIQLVEGSVLVPLVMRNTIGISPLLVLVSLLVGAAVGGLLGALLAVPIVASAEIILSRLQARETPVAQDPAAIETPDEETRGDTNARCPTPGKAWGSSRAEPDRAEPTALAEGGHRDSSSRGAIVDCLTPAPACDPRSGQRSDWREVEKGRRIGRFEPVTRRSRRTMEDIAARQDLDVVLPFDSHLTVRDESPVRRVAPFGGVAAPLAHPDPGHHERGHRPRFGPDLTNRDPARRDGWHDRRGRDHVRREELETAGGEPFVAHLGLGLDRLEARDEGAPGCFEPVLRSAGRDMECAAGRDDLMLGAADECQFAIDHEAPVRDNTQRAKAYCE